ncbi:DUF6745 domain-containing protein [Ferrovum sp.]|uniref:DUF6745 domain-containing protein n=1 Tax=Ferrovum sp. TaxID=2609467 RepID=UPI002637ACFD|nr:hypothetical protein [Ferrovum sp.]
MMEKITELTEDQKAQFKPWVKKWVEIGLSTEPADFDRAEKAALAAYALCGLRPPMVVLRVGSPYAATIAGAVAWDMLRKIKDVLKNQVRDQVWDQVGAQVWTQVGAQVGAQVRDQVGAQVEAQVGAQVRAQVGGLGKNVKKGFDNYGISSLWCTLSSFVSFFLDVCQLILPEEIQKRLEINEALVSSVGWTWWHENVLVLSDRPKIINRDDQDRLHCENGPSMEYRDGWALYHWHGVSIPKEWVSGQKPTAREAISWPQIEQRRAACEIVGWANIIEELDARIIDTDDDPEVGILLECAIPDAGNQRFLKVICGTGRSFVLPVPPSCETALEGNLWTYGIDAHRSFIPEVRT